VIPFDPTDSSFNRDNALYLAHAADVAYKRAPKKAAATRLALDAIPFRSKLTRTRGFLGLCDTHAVLSFRGSDPLTLPNWMTDAIVQLVERDEYHGRVHLGFSTVLKRTWGKVEEALEHVGDRPLFLTGHSMGGALAVLTAIRLAKLGRPPVATYTFGSPRFADLDFCASHRLPTYRIVNRLDLVPEMPLASIAGLIPAQSRHGKGKKVLGKIKRMVQKVPSYAHINTFVYIDRDGAVIEDADVEPWHRHAVTRAIGTRGRSFLEGLTDHLIANYIRALEGQTGKMQTGVRRRVREGR
jgi:pimeloyl-ACP methyl ester carboxylesterase